MEALKQLVEGGARHLSLFFLLHCRLSIIRIMKAIIIALLTKFNKKSAFLNDCIFFSGGLFLLFL